ncbi:MAG: glycine cleavage system aminomethyltransferase GcvT [Chloroflexota bacterium]|nr:glycine cleavage system aminomethyltransferase GcvT [Chloroflexota bacterium]
MDAKLRQTPLHNSHVRLGGRMVEFAGWDMPVQYAGLIAEHKAVRESAGVFDVSHMGEIAISGTDAATYLNHVLTNDVARLRKGRSHYTLICNEAGGVLDDATLYRLDETAYLLVVNAGNAEAGWDWLRAQTGEFSPTLANVSERYSLLAVQGPRAEELLDPATGLDLAKLRRTRIRPTTVFGHEVLIGRTGYTGEDGVEIFAAPEDTGSIWEGILALDIAPAGLGARNTLRLEAGMALHGHELGLDINPIEAGLTRVVAMEKGPFIGRDSLAKVLEAGPTRRLRGLTLTERAVPRDGHPVTTTHGPGVITSGTFSPTLEAGIAMSFVPPECEIGDAVTVNIRDRDRGATLVDTPFFSNVTRWRAKSK